MVVQKVRRLTDVEVQKIEADKKTKAHSKAKSKASVHAPNLPSEAYTVEVKVYANGLSHVKWWGDNAAEKAEAWSTIDWKNLAGTPHFIGAGKNYSMLLFVSQATEGEAQQVQGVASRLKSKRATRNKAQYMFASTQNAPSSHQVFLRALHRHYNQNHKSLVKERMKNESARQAHGKAGKKNQKKDVVIRYWRRENQPARKEK